MEQPLTLEELNDFADLCWNLKYSVAHTSGTRETRKALKKIEDAKFEDVDLEEFDMSIVEAYQKAIKPVRKLAVDAVKVFVVKEDEEASKRKAPRQRKQ